MNRNILLVGLVLLLLFSPFLVNFAVNIVLPSIGLGFNGIFITFNPSILVGGGGDEMDPEVYPS